MSDDHHTVIPYLIVRGGKEAIDYYTKVFGAEVYERYDMPDGKIGHAGLKIGRSVVMLADEVVAMSYVGPQTLGGSPVSFTIHVDNTDAVVQRAVDAGATLDRPVADQFYGLRTGCITDPFGHKWMIAQRVEEVSDEESHRRFNEMMDKK
ncbi:MAG: VOC family protein [Phycisphaera sp.]|nr:VOC family protein [Phycisphaera sp.]